VEPVRYALDYYRRLNEAAKDERHQRKSVIELGEPSGSSGPTLLASGSSNNSITFNQTSCAVVKSNSLHSIQSQRSTGTFQSCTRSIEDEAPCKLELEVALDQESSDPETATEVEVSEKTLKFKISTEGRVGASCAQGRKSYPGSRKGSREKSSLDYYNHDLAKAVREHEREKRRSRGENLSSDMSSPVSARSNDGSRIIEEIKRNEEQQQIGLLLSKAGIAEDNSNLINSIQQQSNDLINKSIFNIKYENREFSQTSPRHLDKDMVRSVYFP
jgi:hypothetical protein